MKLVRRLLLPFVEEGIVSNAELNSVTSNLAALAKTGSPAPAVTPRLLKADEVADLLGISLSAFRHAEAAGEIFIQRRVVGKGSIRYLNLAVFAYMLNGGQEEQEADAADAADAKN